MSRTALEDTKFELIKAHILDPDNSPLPMEKREQLCRVISAAKVLDKHPVHKQAVAIHQQMFPEISTRQAYEDLRFAVKVFNTFHTFDYDFWHAWLINDIVSNIESCRLRNNDKDRKNIALEHANLIKAIGGTPEEVVDPERNEKHQFYILIQNNHNKNIKVDFNSLKDLPEATLRELNRAIYGGNEITDVEAEELMKT